MCGRWGGQDRVAVEVQWNLAGSSQWKMRKFRKKLKRGYEGAEGVRVMVTRISIQGFPKQTED